jgi:hypothetical protein
MAILGRLAAYIVAVVAIATGDLALAAGPPALEPPTPAAIAEGHRLVDAMRDSDRGPYARLRWFCADGAVLPPQSYACRDRGGGHQYGEYSDQRQRLVKLGWPVGTILTATPWDELWDGDQRHRRLRELLVERHLVAVDDGWVMHRARYYRGHIQVEDEEEAGRALLIQLSAHRELLDAEWLLVREAVRSLPHHTGSDRTQLIRRVSQEIAEKDRSFERLRIKIHTAPSAADVESVRDWIAAARTRGADPAIIPRAEELMTAMARLYGGGDTWLEPARAALAKDPRWPEIEKLLAAIVTADSGQPRAAALGRALATIRDLGPTSDSGTRNLALLDLSLGLERELIQEAFTTLETPARSRRELLALVQPLLDGSYGAGLLSRRERDEVVRPLERLAAGANPQATDYAAAIQGVRRVAGWAQGAVRFSFAEALASYGALEPKAFRFVDDVLRGSAVLPLAEAATSLAADADRVAGVSHRLFGQRYGGVLGLNPGLASGRLWVMTTAEIDGGMAPSRDEIVVLPRTVSDLAPVAGILTLAEGNLLSHIHLLARNLGIPNASLSPTLAAELASHAGREVVFAVAADGSVVVEELAMLTPEVLAVVSGSQASSQAPAAKMAAPVPDLTIRRPIPLAELSAGMAGTVVGPKAANLGELATHFPGRVEQAVALPFGVFAAHVADGPGSPRAILDAAYTAHREGRLDDAGLVAAVDVARVAVEAMSLRPALDHELSAVMAELFGPPGTYGVFVRSDTNVEDLPGFTGAGLNETIPNVVDPAAQRRAIARVWASPFRERSVAWRAPLLTNPEEVYTSVLIMKSVPADKSGVMVTTDLVRRRPGLTVAAAWGVGGAVDGDAAETVVLAPDGSHLLVGEAKAPYRRKMRPAGGVEWVPAASGRVLSDDEQMQLRTLAAEIGSRLEPHLGADGAPLPWDVEFGFVGGKLELFQIRPLVERGSARADRAVAALSPPPVVSSGAVALSDEIPVRSLPMEATAR